MKLFQCLKYFFEPKNPMQEFIKRHNPQSVYDVERLQKEYDNLIFKLK